MQKLALLPCLVLLLFATSCKNGDVAPKSPSAPAAETAMDPPPTAEPMVAPVKDPPPDSMAPSAAAPPLEFPPVDLTCTTDADCRFSSVPKLEGRVCCHGCPYHPASRAWVQQVVKLCDEYNAKNKAFGCPKINCSELKDVACVNGECRVRK